MHFYWSQNFRIRQSDLVQWNPQQWHFYIVHYSYLLPLWGLPLGVIDIKAGRKLKRGSWNRHKFPLITPKSSPNVLQKPQHSACTFKSRCRHSYANWLRSHTLILQTARKRAISVYFVVSKAFFNHLCNFLAVEALARAISSLERSSATLLTLFVALSRSGRGVTAYPRARPNQA